MANVLDYIDWRGDLTFKQSPFCEVDGLILGLLSYMELSGIADGEIAKEGITLSSAAKKYFKKFGDNPPSMGILIPKEFPMFFKKAAESARYGDMRLFGYKSVISTVSETQFAAVCISVGDGSLYVSYRGTDDTLVGWKENFNMSFMDSVEAQRLALDYLIDASKCHRGKIRVGGHSKGGNLAMYAAINSPKRLRTRILDVYNNDGPGFINSIENTEGYIALKERIHTNLPHYCVVGLLLEHTTDYKVVKCSADGIFQHDPFSWEIMGERFVREKTLSKECLKVERSIKAWLRDIDNDKRSEFVEAVHKVFTANSAQTLTDIAEDKFDFIRSLSKLDTSVRDVIISTGKILVREGWNTARNKKKGEDSEK